jgi:hypothetical protein
MGGLFGGVLIPVPNTNIFMGPRLGWQGGNISGSIVAPPASPFTYKVTTNSIFYQEAMVEIPFFQDLYHRLYDEPPAQKLAYPPNLFLPFVTASAGIAEVHTDVKGTLGGFSVTDGGYRPGITLTTGLGVPVGVVMNGATVDVFVQWRGTMTTATVNIPGSVPQVYWVNGIDFGVQFRY